MDFRCIRESIERLLRFGFDLFDNTDDFVNMLPHRSNRAGDKRARQCLGETQFQVGFSLFLLTFRYELLFPRNVSLRLRFWELPSSVEDLFARAIEPHRVVPTGHDWQTVGPFAVAAAELNRDRPIAVFLRGDIVK